ncbi:hypothetical protein [Nocardia sp. NPDC047654]|uniref:hypothetical protein n=1 Tax=Nocardia sp. NPDC047654 TaxID=3364314 RepID=UPI003714B471
MRELSCLGGLIVSGHLIYAGLQRTREQVADHDARVWGADPAVWVMLEHGTNQLAGIRRVVLFAPLRRTSGGARGPLALVVRFMAGFVTRVAATWQTHPMSAQRCRWLAESGFIGDNHGKILPSFLAVGTCMLTAVGMNRIWPRNRWLPTRRVDHFHRADAGDPVLTE